VSNCFDFVHFQNISLISLWTPLSLFWKSYIVHNPKPWLLFSLSEATMCYNLYMHTRTPTSFFSPHLTFPFSWTHLQLLIHAHLYPYFLLLPSWSPRITSHLSFLVNSSFGHDIKYEFSSFQNKVSLTFHPLTRGLCYCFWTSRLRLVTNKRS